MGFDDDCYRLNTIQGEYMHIKVSSVDSIIIDCMFLDGELLEDFLI